MNTFKYLCLAITATFAPALSQGTEKQSSEVRRGTVQSRQVISVALTVPNTGKESKRMVYAPPPGWYIRSHHITCTKKQGLASFTVTTVPARWKSTSEDVSGDASKISGEAEANVGMWKAAKAKASGGKERSATEKHTESFSHHAIVLEAMAQGGGFLRSGASIELTVTAEMVFVGND